MIFATRIRPSFKSACLVLAIAAAFPAGAHEGPARPGASRRLLATQPLPAPYPPEALVTVSEISYPPGGTTAPHSHPGPVFVYVLEGAVASRLDEGPEKIYRAGESWYEQPQARHMVSRNASATAPARFLVFFLSAKGEALVQSVGEAD